MFFRRTPLAVFVVAVAVGMVVGACTVGPGPESKGPDACAVYAQAKVKLEDGSITLEQARPDFQRVLALAREAARVRSDWRDLEKALTDMLAATEPATFAEADGRAWQVCAPVVGT